jgi:hypothetical protein
MLVRNPNFPAENVVRFTNDLFRNPRSFSFGPDFSFAQNSAGTRMMLPTTLQDRVRSLTQSPGGGEGAPGDRLATQDTGSMRRGPSAPATPSPGRLSTSPRLGELPATPSEPPGGAVAWAARVAPRQAAESVGARERQQRDQKISEAVSDIRSRLESIRSEELRRIALRIGGITPAKLLEMARQSED